MLGYKALAKLGRKKYRQEYNCFLVEGKKPVLEAIQAGQEIVQLVWRKSFPQEQPEFCNLSEINTYKKSGKVYELPNGDFAKLVETVQPQGIAAVVRLPQNILDPLLSNPVLAVLEDIRDPGNVGTIIRTADWFGVSGLVCLGGADPFQPKVVRASMGSIFRIPIFHIGRTELEDSGYETLATIKQAGFQIIATRPEATDAIPTTLPATTQPKRCFVFGNEAHGTSPKLDRLADQSISIPRYGAAESLNVAISFGIIMHHAVKHHAVKQHAMEPNTAKPHNKV